MAAEEVASSRSNWKIPKGVVDLQGDEYLKLMELFRIIEGEMLLIDGITPLETPVFELREV